MDLFYFLFYFVIYAFFGWVLEVLYLLLNTGKFVNRGMLNGPYCPIYAFGALGMLIFLENHMDNFWVTFASSIVIGTLLELIAGIFIDKIFKMKFWDYSDKPFNIGGYICPIFSLAWGFVGAIFSRNIHPFVSGIAHFLPDFLVVIFSCAGILVIAVDTIITVLDMLKFKSLVEKLSSQKQMLKNLSDSLGQDITDNAIKLGRSIKEKEEELKNFRENLDIRIDIRQKRYEEEIENFRQNVKNTYHKNKRRFKAFPRLRSSIKDYRDIIDQIKRDSE